MITNNRVNPNEYLDILPDLSPDDPQHYYFIEELYSDEQLTRKIERICSLRDSIMHQIIFDILPFLSQAGRKASSTIGFVFRNKDYREPRYYSGSVFNYITIRCHETEKPCTTIKYVDTQINTMEDELPELASSTLSSLGKSKNDILYRGSTALTYYFEENILHKVIYGDLKNLIEDVFDK